MTVDPHQKHGRAMVNYGQHTHLHQQKFFFCELNRVDRIVYFAMKITR
jgi:hypothetical protein